MSSNKDLHSLLNWLKPCKVRHYQTNSISHRFYWAICKLSFPWHRLKCSTFTEFKVNKNGWFAKIVDSQHLRCYFLVAFQDASQTMQSWFNRIIFISFISDHHDHVKSYMIVQTDWSWVVLISCKDYIVRVTCIFMVSATLYCHEKCILWCVYKDLILSFKIKSLFNNELIKCCCHLIFLKSFLVFS